MSDIRKDGIRDCLQGQRFDPWAWMWKPTLDNAVSSLFGNFAPDAAVKKNALNAIIKVNQQGFTFFHIVKLCSSGTTKKGG